MKAHHFKYLMVQVIIVLAVFSTFILILLRYQQSERSHRLASTAQSISYSIQQHFSTTEGSLTSLAYSDEIDDSLDTEKLDLLAK